MNIILCVRKQIQQKGIGTWILRLCPINKIYFNEFLTNSAINKYLWATNLQTDMAAVNIFPLPKLK